MDLLQDRLLGGGNLGARNSERRAADTALTFAAFSTFASAASSAT
jgi:hypothetical protein